MDPMGYNKADCLSPAREKRNDSNRGHTEKRRHAFVQFLHDLFIVGINVPATRWNAHHPRCSEQRWRLGRLQFMEECTVDT